MRREAAAGAAVVALLREADVATNYEAKTRKKGARIMLAGYRRL